MSQFSLNTDSIVFLGKVDEANDYSTIAYDWKTGDVYKIHQAGYFLLKYIQENSPISQPDLESYKSKLIASKQKLIDLIEEFKKRGIIVETLETVANGRISLVKINE